MKVFEISAVGQLQAYRETWHNLLQQTPNASFFQSLDWLEVYWQHFGVGQQLRVLVVQDDSAIQGFLPLVVRLENTKVGRLRFATYPLDHWGSYYGPISADPNLTLAAGLDFLGRSQQDWDVLEPRWIGAEPGECERVEALLQAAGHAPLRGDFDATAVIRLDGNWASYLATRDGKWRNNARRWERQLSQRGEISHLRFRPDAGPDADPGWRHYDECLRIAANSWQGSSTTGTTLTHETVSGFLRDVHLAAARTGCLDLNLLQLDGRAVAFTYNYVYRGNVFSLRSGYDPNCQVNGAGSLLYIKAIEDSFARHDWQYDLGPRHLECKRKLLTHVMPVYRISCFKRWSVRQQLIRLKRNLEAAPAVPELRGASVAAETV